MCVSSGRDDVVVAFLAALYRLRRGERVFVVVGDRVRVL